MSDLPTKHENYSTWSLGDSDEAGDVSSAFRDRMIDSDVKEKNAGSRFHDSGERIPGRQKGLNDKYPGHPAKIHLLGPGR